MTIKVSYEERSPLSLIDEANEEFQARLDYDEEELARLAEDIRQNGQRNPIGIRRRDERYQVIYGFQRVKAVKSLGWDSIRANIYEGATETELHIHSVSDNVRHGDLTHRRETGGI